MYYSDISIVGRFWGEGEANWEGIYFVYWGAFMCQSFHQSFGSRLPVCKTNLHLCILCSYWLLWIALKTTTNPAFLEGRAVQLGGRNLSICISCSNENFFCLSWKSQRETECWFINSKWNKIQNVKGNSFSCVLGWIVLLEKSPPSNIFQRRKVGMQDLG